MGADGSTCATCHDTHATDRVRTANGQAQVCTVCHAVQREGVHNFAGSGGEDPPCSRCHEPHADPAPQTTLLANRSAGCRACHDLKAMAATYIDKALQPIRDHFAKDGRARKLQETVASYQVTR